MSKIISFEGLNRSGKRTQIYLLRNYFKSANHPVEVLRGDGSRPGIDSSGFYDPQSKWWKDWQCNQNKSSDDWNLAYEVLSSENNSRLNDFFQDNPEGTIIMDRSYISRYFMLMQQGVNISLEDVARDTQVIPDLYFFLEVPKEILLERVSDDNPSKTEFRREIVKKWYNLWDEVVGTAQEFLKDAFERIDGTQSPESIHNYVKLKI